jgi:tetratricopeptide (TPR) repeat protein
MPDSAYVVELLRAGIAAVKAGHKEKARQALLKVTELDERNEQAWLWLSGVVESAEDRRVCLENVLAINPRNSHAQAGLAWLDQQQAIPPPVAQDHDRCPRCQSPVPLSKTACARCGQVLIVACPACFQYVDVRQVKCPHCRRTLGNFATGAPYYLALAQAYREQQRYDLVQEAAAHAEAEAHDDPHLLEQVAALHEDMGHTDQAIAVYQRALERDLTNAALYGRLGAIYRRRAMPGEARVMYERAAQQTGGHPAVLFELAQVYLDAGETARGFGLLERIVRLDPDHAEAHLVLGDLYLAQGQRAQAVQHYERASALLPSSTLHGREARFKLGKLRPALPEQQTQGWGETLRLMSGLMLSPALVALVNARLLPWLISPAAWVALILASAGACLWVCATGVPRNPLMRALFGPAGVKGTWQQALVGIPGALLWAGGLGLVLWKA